MADMKLVRRKETRVAINPETGLPDPELPMVEEIIEDIVPLDVDELEEREEWNTLNLRSIAKKKTEDHFLSLISSDFPFIKNLEDAKLFDLVVLSIRAASYKVAFTRALQHYDYVKLKIIEIESMTAEEAQTYDPTTDINWPVPV